MSFRARLALVAAAAVALAVLTASFVVYFVVRDQLRSTVDDSLKTTAGQMQELSSHTTSSISARLPASSGGASIYPQVVDANGRVYPTSSDARDQIAGERRRDCGGPGRARRVLQRCRGERNTLSGADLSVPLRSPDLPGRGYGRRAGRSLADRSRSFARPHQEPAHPHCRRRNRDCGRARTGRIASGACSGSPTHRRDGERHRDRRPVGPHRGQRP